MNVISITSIVIAVFSIYFTWFLYTSRESRLIPPLISLAVGIFLWSSITFIIEITSTSYYLRVFESIKFLGASSILVGWLYFCLFATGHSTCVDKRWLGFHIITGVMMGVFVATNDFHNLVWYDKNSGNLSSRQSLFWFYFTYCYLLYFIGIGVILEKLFVVHYSQKTRYGLIAFAGTLPIIVNSLYTFEILPNINVDYTIFSFIISLVLLWIAVTKVKLLDVEYISNTVLVNSITDGIVVIDNQHTILSINNQTTCYFDTVTDSSIGLNAKSVIQNWEEIKSILLPDEEKSMSLNFSNEGDAKKVFEIRSIPFKQSYENSRFILIFKDITKLYEAYEKIELLSQLIPICSSCKKIRDDQGYWNNLESYLSKHTKLEFTHGICDDCIRKLYPEVADDYPDCN